MPGPALGRVRSCRTSADGDRFIAAGYTSLRLAFWFAPGVMLRSDGTYGFIHPPRTVAAFAKMLLDALDRPVRGLPSAVDLQVDVARMPDHLILGRRNALRRYPPLDTRWELSPNDSVTLDADFETFPDGVNHLASATLN